MKRLVAITLLAITVAYPAMAQRAENKRAQDRAVQQELLRLEYQWAEAAGKGDLAVLDRIEADEYTLTGPTGSVLDKKEDMEQYRSGALVIEAFQLSDLNVRVYGQTAVVTGQSMIRGKEKGVNISGPYRFTDVFVKRDGRWQCVASQVTRIVKP